MAGAAPPASQAPLREVSVAYGDDAAILAGWRADGVVVVRGVLSDDDVACAVGELWDSPRLLGRDGAVRRDDPSTWGGGAWPQQDGGRNFLASLDAFQDRSCWELLQHPCVVRLQRLLHGGAVMSDGESRWGVMRPTADHPEWRTDESWLHWDQNPWHDPGFARVQCFACLTDQTPTSGGFLCAPGFHHRWRAWGDAHPEGSVTVGGKAIGAQHGRGQPFPVPADDPAQAEVVRVLAARGSMVFWDGRIPHQNYPNTGREMRIVQYLSFSPATDAARARRAAALARKLVALRVLGRDRGFFPGGLTDLGREVTGTPAEGADAGPELAEAIRLLADGGALEAAGDEMAAMEKFRRAEKVHPDIADWHDAVFGGAAE